MEERIDNALKFIKDTIIDICKNVVVDFVDRHRIISVFIVLILILIGVGLSMLKKDSKNKNTVTDKLIEAYNSGKNRECLQCIEENIKNIKESPKKSVQRSAQKDLKKNIEKAQGYSGIYFFKPCAYYFVNDVAKIQRNSFKIDEEGFFRIPLYLINISNKRQPMKAYVKVQKKDTGLCVKLSDEEKFVLHENMALIRGLRISMQIFSGTGKGDYEIILNINNKDIYKSNIKIF